MNKKFHKLGEKADQSGLVEIVGPRGGKTGKQRTVVKDEPFPPTPKAGQQYVMGTPAKNGAGKSKK